jgi:DNA-directed RNA polymerase subunit L
MILTLNNDNFNIPDNWDELSQEQFLKIANLSNLKLSPNKFKAYVLISLLNMNVASKLYSNNHTPCYKLTNNKTKKIYLVSVEDIAYTVVNSLNWIFKEIKSEKSSSYEINCRITKTVIPHITIHSEKWYGPDSAMSNSTYEEYIRCLVSASEFSQGKQDGLNKLIAALYRPGSISFNDNGDMRSPYNDHLINVRASLASKVDDITKTAILLQFNGHISTLEKTFPFAFTGHSSSSSSQNTPQNIFFRQLDLIDNLAQHKISEKENVRKSQLYDVLHTLDNIVRNKPKKPKKK